MNNKISTGLKNLFLIHFIVGLAFGIVYFTIPAVYGKLAGWNILDPAAYRIIGAAILAISASSWLCYKNPYWDTVKIVVVLEMVWTFLASLASIWGIIFEGFPAIAWLNVCLLLFFALAFTFYYFKERKSQTA